MANKKKFSEQDAKDFISEALKLGEVDGAKVIVEQTEQKCKNCGKSLKEHGENADIFEPLQPNDNFHRPDPVIGGYQPRAGMNTPRLRNIEPDAFEKEMKDWDNLLNPRKNELDVFEKWLVNEVKYHENRRLISNTDGLLSDEAEEVYRKYQKFKSKLKKEAYTNGLDEATERYAKLWVDDEKKIRKDERNKVLKELLQMHSTEAVSALHKANDVNEHGSGYPFQMALIAHIEAYKKKLVL